MEGSPKPQLPVLILIVIGYTLLSRNQVVLLVDLSNMYLYPDNELIIMRLNHVECLYCYQIKYCINILHMVQLLIASTG